MTKRKPFLEVGVLLFIAGGMIAVFIYAVIKVGNSKEPILGLQTSATVEALAIPEQHVESVHVEVIDGYTYREFILPSGARCISVSSSNSHCQM